MFNINWLNLRSLNNSQNNAFEELVCQLANEEPIEDKKSFTRLGAPDGGVEGYCTLEDGSEYGWQAKFFLTMGDNQWEQIESSLKRAIDTHPRLIKYFICIPMDRQDPRIPNQNWFMDKWNQKVKKWSEYAEKHGRKIEFEYWGSSELLARLSQEKNAGRFFFWFNKDELTNEWFTESLRYSIDSLGNRYSPELNYELEIAKHFDGLARNESFQLRLQTVQDSLLKKAKKAISQLVLEDFQELRSQIQIELKQIEFLFQQLSFSNMEKLNYKDMLDSLNRLDSLVTDCAKNFLELRHKQEISLKSDTNENRNTKYANEINKLREFENSIHYYIEFLNSPSVILSNHPFLLIRGEAGIGKSHLIADIVKTRQNNGEMSLLLLGQHFTSEDNPWTQILDNILRVRSTSVSEFLGALNAKAEANGSRIIVFIDAINEGKGIYFWQDHIRSFIRSFEKYKWLGLVLSVRTSYENLLANKEILPEDMILRVTHYGFSENEYEASKSFFEYYQIQQPSIPLLHPEFRNPLFLKLFCEGLNKSGYTTIPEGYEGISTIINFYLHGINKRLSDPGRLHYPEQINLVDKAVKLLIQMKLEKDSRYIPYEEAYLRLEELLKQYSSKTHLLEALLSEGIITRNVFWLEKDRYEEGVYLAYERFADHFEANFLIENHLDINNPREAFSEEGNLFYLFKDNQLCYANKGLLEAFSIQIPEKVGKELYELVPYSTSYYPFIQSFVESLIWRKTETITSKLKEYINSHVIKYSGTHHLFLDTLILLSSRPNHYLNANFLHSHLMRFSMAKRDSWWTVYIHNQFIDESPVKRLVDWAWADEDKRYISDEAILLSSTTLAWFLTSSNRFLRDSATKALVNLLQSRIEVLIKLLKQFKDVNDPYVAERLYAVAYGCTLRTSQKSKLKDLSIYIYQEIFNKEFIYPHILLRDYAKGVIEYSLTLFDDICIDIKKIRPPYKSKWNSAEVFDEIDIEQYEFDYKAEGFKEFYWSQNEIIYSMRTKNSGGYGDFGRYVFESAFTPWKDLDTQKLSDLAVKRIFELGYDVEMHGEFDRTVNRYSNVGREARKAERIGKKYQWIAFYELLALVSDHFQMYEEISWENMPIDYEGPWEPYVRDIDPTILIKETGKGQHPHNNTNWWFNTSYSNWDLDNNLWVEVTDDFPDPTKFLIVRDEEGLEWFVLESHPQWSEPEKLGEDRWATPHKRLWYQFRSYLVPQNRYKKTFEWLSNQNFMGRWMPEAESIYQVFSREYYWSPAYQFFKKPRYSEGEWKDLIDQDKVKLGKVMVTTEHFLWEEPYDCSKVDTISYLKPCKSIFRGMNLRIGQNEGELLDSSNTLVCFDPSVNHKSMSCLLVKKDEFLDYLQKNKLKIIWTFLGEKQIIGGNSHHRENAKWLELSGAYYYGDSIIGSYKSHLISQS